MSAILPRNISAVYLFAILAVATALRFCKLSNIPPGLSMDEAFFSRDGWDIAFKGDWRWVYYELGEAHLPLFSALLAAGFALLGDTLLAPRATVALMGLLCVGGSYLLALELFHTHPRKRIIALLTALLLATSYWHVNFSRLIFSASIVPTLQVLALWLTLLALRRRTLWLATAAGAATALGLYSFWQYLPFILAPLLLVARAPARQLAGFGAALLLASLPFVYIALNYPLVKRLDALWMPPEGLGTIISELLRHAWLTVSMLFIEGDTNWRHNFAGDPHLSIPAMVGVVLGLVALPRSRAGAVLIGWIALASLPAIFSWEALPHASRAIGMVVPLQMLAAYGLELLWHRLCVDGPLSRIGRIQPLLAAIVLLELASYQIGTVAWRYLVQFPQERWAIKAFELVDLREMWGYGFVQDSAQIRRMKAQ